MLGSTIVVMDILLLLKGLGLVGLPREARPMGPARHAELLDIMAADCRVVG